MVTAAGVMARAAPSVAAAVAFAAPQGQSYTAVARSAGNDWVNVGRGWIPVLLGELSGDLGGLPAVGAPPASLANGNHGALPEWIPTVTPAARQVLQHGAQKGRNPRVFTVAGDSNSQWPRFLGRVAAGAVDWGRYPGLRPVAARFDPSFTRLSLAVRGGTGAFAMADPAQAGSPPCRAGEGMFDCELRVSNASIVFIQLGTGDKFAWREFEANCQRLIAAALEQGVLPVLVTKADDIEEWQGGASHDFINSTLRRLAQQYQIPLLDFWAATRTLPMAPNPDLPHRPFTQFGLQDEWGYYFHLTDEGMALRILTTLQTLDALTRGR